MTDESTELDRGWRLAESRAPKETGKVEADPLSLKIGGAALLAGVDSKGTRHLLIPIDPSAVLPDDPVGAAIALRKRTMVVDGAGQTYLDLTCSRPDLFDEFAVLARDVVRAVLKERADPVRATADVLAAWRELLRALSPARLDRSGIIGLFGELSILERLQKVDAREAVEAWTGPTGGRFDFQRAQLALEIKTATARHGRPFVIHGLDQLDVPQDMNLYLWWIRLEIGIDRGVSLHTLTSRVLDASLSPSAVEQKLRNLGYELDQQEIYDRPLFNELESRLYLVNPEFPKLTRANFVGGELPRGVTAVSYEVDLSGNIPAPIDVHLQNELIAKLAK